MFAASKTGGVVASSGDPYWTSVSLLTNFENNLSFQDGSTNNFAITRNGVVNPSLNTPFSGGVGGSEYFNGSTGYLSTPSSSSLDILSGGDFTVECWFYANTISVNGGYGNNLANRESSLGTDGWEFRISPSGIEFVYGGLSGNLQAFTFATATWYHVVAQRTGSVFNYYINGTKYTPIYVNRTVDSASALRVGLSGASAGSTSYFNGFISNLRIVKGTAVYTANFTPPTAPLTAITNTSLLITGTGQGMFNNSTFVDQGPNALTVTATGAPVYSGLSPYGNTYPGSVLFNGTTSYLTAPTNAAFQFGTGDFTIECWVNKPSAANSVIFDARGSATAVPYAAYIDASNFPYFYDGTVYTSTVAITNNVWNHVAWVRTSGTLKMFVNGVQGYSAAYSTALNPSSTVYIGGQNFSTPVYTTGYISNLRIVKGTAVYTTGFTPSTTPLTAITNTSLLVRGDTGAFYDLSIVGNPESGTGSPVVTTQVKKFGNESGSFNGTTSYLTTPDNAALNMGAADFTLEAWIYLTSTPALQANAGANVINKDGKFFVSWAQYNLYVNSALKVCANFSSVPNGGAGPTATIVGTTTLSLNTWYYVAVTRSGVNGTVWVNGASNGTTASIPATLANGARSLYIGYEEAQAAFAYFPGYIDDIRITKGVARTITTPTVTFPTGP